jgi:hypothetical protein
MAAIRLMLFYTGNREMSRQPVMQIVFRDKELWKQKE